MTGEKISYILSEAGASRLGSVLGRLKISEAWDNAANTSVFTLTIQARFSGSGSLTTAWRTRGTISVDGTVIIPNDVASTVQVASEWVDIAAGTTEEIPHNADGTLTITLGRQVFSSSFPCVGPYASYGGSQYLGDCGAGDLEIACHVNDVSHARIFTGGAFERAKPFIWHGGEWVAARDKLAVGGEWR